MLLFEMLLGAWERFCLVQGSRSLSVFPGKLFHLMNWRDHRGTENHSTVACQIRAVQTLNNGRKREILTCFEAVLQTLGLTQISWKFSETFLQIWPQTFHKPSLFLGISVWFMLLITTWYLAFFHDFISQLKSRMPFFLLQTSKTTPKYRVHQPVREGTRDCWLLSSVFAQRRSIL